MSYHGDRLRLRRPDRRRWHSSTTFLTVSLLLFMTAIQACEADDSSDSTAPAARSTPSVDRSNATAAVSPTEGTASPTMTTPSPTRPEGAIVVVYPPGTRADIEVVDRVLEAVEEQNLAELMRLSQLRVRPCTGHEQGPGVVTCPDSAPVGTPVDRFSTSLCDGALVALDALPEVWDQFFRSGYAGSSGPAPMHLYAVARVDGDSIGLGTRYQSVFSSPAGWPHQIWLDGQGIVSVRLGCDETSPLDVRYLGDQPADFLLPPK